ncbi:hypothetical protein [Bacillus ndiopicus]|uniref:hypothetical protein n=1 Tax=Bacillus ndiopicus TaxID=1347368 RepID=UPI0005A996C2|nr:hypothetical protein [Bacillus ndiopicus]
MVMATFRMQPIKTVFSILFIILGMVTMMKYQQLEVGSIESVIALIQSQQFNGEVYKTLYLNVTSFLSLLIIALFWIKPALKRNWHYEYAGGQRWINIIVSILLVTFSFVFSLYLLQKFTGFIVAGVLMMLIFGNSDSQGQRESY